MDSVSSTSTSVTSQQSTEDVLPKHDLNWSRIGIVLAVAVFSGLLFGSIGYIIGISRIPSQSPVQSQEVKKELPPVPTTTTTSVSTSAFKIIGLYELADSVVYVTDKPSYSTFYFWFNPQLRNTTYGDGKLVAHTNTTMQKGEGYQFILYKQNITDGIKSDSYFFEGNRTIIADPRCPVSINTNNKNIVTAATCKDNEACIKDFSFISNTCPRTEIITPTPTPEPSISITP